MKHYIEKQKENTEEDAKEDVCVFIKNDYLNTYTPHILRVDFELNPNNE